MLLFLGYGLAAILVTLCISEHTYSKYCNQFRVLSEDYMHLQNYSNPVFQSEEIEELYFAQMYYGHHRILPSKKGLRGQFYRALADHKFSPWRWAQPNRFKIFHTFLGGTMRFPLLWGKGGVSPALTKNVLIALTTGKVPQQFQSQTFIIPTKG